jgi:hypothetical protein
MPPSIRAAAVAVVASITAFGTTAGLGGTAHAEVSDAAALGRAPAAMFEVRGTTGGLVGGDLGREWSVRGGAYTFGGGVRWHRIGVDGLFGMVFLDSSRPERDTGALFGFQFGGDVVIRPPITAELDLVLRGGWRWRRVAADSGTSVERTCNQTGDCLGGVWHEVPTYWANGPLLGIGVEDRFLTHDRRIAFSIRLELEAGTIDADVPGMTGGRATYVGLSLGGGIGHVWR